MVKVSRKKKHSSWDLGGSKGKVIGSIAVVCLLVAIFSLCKEGTDLGEKVELSEREAYRYNKALAQVKEVDSLWSVCSQDVSPEQIRQLFNKIRKLKYEYNENGMNVATLKRCDSLQQRIEYLQTTFIEEVEHGFLKSDRQVITETPNVLLEEKTSYPFFLRKGEKLYLDIHVSETAIVQLRNADIEKILRTYKNVATDTVTIENEGVYVLEIQPKEKQYASVKIGYKPVSSKDLYNRPVVSVEKVECEKGDVDAVASKGVKMKNLFEEPRKFTLRGQIKAAFSGSPKALVALQIPAGTTDILYTMRIDTSEGHKSDDGKFHENLNYSYRKIKMLGLPVYESAKSSGILNMILDDNRPIRDEDAYCNMYVFRNQAQAKKFQDNVTPIAELKYDVDYSTLGTQSCNGRIPANGAKTIYLGFENERMRYANYLWVEAVAVVPTTLYYKEKYTIE